MKINNLYFNIKDILYVMKQNEKDVIIRFRDTTEIYTSYENIEDLKKDLISFEFLIKEDKF